jgi:hypothetical protein
MKANSGDIVLFDPRPAIQWKSDPQAQRHATNRDYKGQNPQGGTAINVYANSDMGQGKLEFLQNNQVMSTMDVEIKAGMNRFQWAMRGPAQAGAGAGGRGGRGGRGGNAPDAAAPAAQPAAEGAQAQAGGRGGRGGAAGVPFVSAGGGFGGSGGGGFGGGAAQGALVQPGAYMVRLTIGSQVLTSSVDVLEDVWMRPL